MNRKDGKKIAVMAALIMGFMVIAFMPFASAGVTDFTVTPSTGIAGAVDSYNVLVTTDGVTSINITIPAGFLAVAPTTGGVEVARVDFWNSSTKAYYGYATITANDTNPTTKVDVYCEFGGATATTTQDVDYAPGATNSFVSNVGGDTSSAIIKLPREKRGGSIKITITCTDFQLDDVMIAIRQYVRNPTTAGDYVFSADGVDETVTIRATGGYGGAVHRGRQWILRTENSPLAQVIRTDWGMATDTPITGDWDGDGVDTIGVFRDGQWILSNSNTNPNADIRTNWGMDTDIPVVGNWDGIGGDTIGVFRDGQWILSNSNTNPNADIRTNWGLAGDRPVVGTWAGIGGDTIGVRRGVQWILSNSNTNPTADIRTNWGLGTDTPITEDWDGIGGDTIGVRRGVQWILSNSNINPSVADRFNYGMSTDEPVTGYWV
jgi:signal peptidase I